MNKTSIQRSAFVRDHCRSRCAAAAASAGDADATAAAAVADNSHTHTETALIEIVCCFFNSGSTGRRRRRRCWLAACCLSTFCVCVESSQPIRRRCRVEPRAALWRWRRRALSASPILERMRWQDKARNTKNTASKCAKFTEKYTLSSKKISIRLSVCCI